MKHALPRLCNALLSEVHCSKGFWGNTFIVFELVAWICEYKI